MRGAAIAAMSTAAVVAASGCATTAQAPARDNPEIAFHTRVPKVRIPGSGSIAIAVQDGRAEVRSREEPPEYCGVFYNLKGFAFMVKTASNGSLSADFAYVIARGLRAAGFRVAVVKTPPGQADAATFEAFRSNAANRSLLIVIEDWATDTNIRTFLKYRVSAFVWDEQGREIARNQISGSDNLGGGMTPADHLREVVPDATRERLELLLNAPTIAQALTAAPRPPSDARPPPTAVPAALPLPSGVQAPPAVPAP